MTRTPKTKRPGPGQERPTPERPNRFRRRHLELERRTVDAGDGPVEVLANAAESPLAWLRRRRGADGRPLIDEAAFAAGERLRADIERAGLRPRVTLDWTRAPVDGARGPADVADATLDANSTRLARSQMSGHDDAAAAATLASFQNLIAQDSVRNNYKLRRQILSWLAAAPARSPIALADLNSRVYAELFLTPATDPWLGLKPEGAYSALSDETCGTEARSDRVMR